MSNRALAAVPATQTSSSPAATVPAAEPSSGPTLVAADVGPDVASVTVNITSTGSMSVNPQNLVITAPFDGVIVFAIDSATGGGYTFMDGLAFTVAPPTFQPMPTFTIPWTNALPKDAAPQTFNYVLAILSIGDGVVSILDPTVENDPPPPGGAD